MVEVYMEQVNVVSEKIKNGIRSDYFDVEINKSNLELGLECSSLVFDMAFANNMVSDVEIATMINEFKPIDVKELPQAVQDAIKENYSEATIKEAAVEVAEDGTKTYKVMLVDAAGTENPVLFNEKGEVQK